jgi:hypothetical protein
MDSFEFQLRRAAQHFIIEAEEFYIRQRMKQLELFIEMAEIALDALRVLI